MDNKFYWGVATSAYQIEGNSNKKGHDIWDDFCEKKGNIEDNSDGSVACDHINRFKEDVALMKKLGIKAYRFSLSWSRIFPEGIGQINKAGVLFYHKLIDCLLENGITPFITVFHWDLPSDLQAKGGWQNPEIVNWFASYCKFVASEYSNQVKYFITLNEPQCFDVLGYFTGQHAPGFKVSLAEELKIIHITLMAHGAGVRALRENAKQEIKIGYAPTSGVALPATNKQEDIEAARNCYFSCKPTTDPGFLFTVPIFSDPILLGDYPLDYYTKYKDFIPEITKADLKLISTPIDFLAQNIYNGYPVASDGKGGYKYLDRKIGFDHTDMNWPWEPTSLYWGPKFLYERYKKPLIISENGMANADVIFSDGKVHDPQRIEFLQQYLKQLLKAKAEGVDLRGYFLWSLLDNFEWNNGYTKRFGLVYVDYQNQKRIIKDSGYFYRDFIKNQENKA